MIFTKQKHNSMYFENKMQKNKKCYSFWLVTAVKIELNTPLLKLKKKQPESIKD